MAKPKQQKQQKQQKRAADAGTATLRTPRVRRPRPPKGQRAQLQLRATIRRTRVAVFEAQRKRFRITPFCGVCGALYDGPTWACEQCMEGTPLTSDLPPLLVDAEALDDSYEPLDA